MIDRNIPKDVKFQLRREVNWGCPVIDCGSAFLTYHHFDPPFADFKLGQIHRPEGMIALCLAHAKMADIGVFTNEQLREMKARPFLSSGLIGGRLEWLRKEIIFRFGKFSFIHPKILLQVRGKNLIWVERDPSGNMLLNMDFPSSTGEPLLTMNDNNWEIFGVIAELNAIPSQRSIEVNIPKEKFSISMYFNDLPQGDNSALEVTLSGEIVYPIPIRFASNDTSIQGIPFGNVTIAGFEVAVEIN